MKPQAPVRLLTGLLLVVVFLFLAACSDGGEAATATKRPTATPAPSPTPGEMVEARLVRISDGDTIVVEIDGLEYRVRYLGMDTPETHHPDIGAQWLGLEATEANRALLAGGTVMLEKDISDADHYDRILRYIWVDGQMVQLELLRQGLARVGFYEPDIKYCQQFFTAEREAQQAKRGLWGPKPTPAPEQPFADGSTGWVVAPDGGTTVGVWHDPAVDQPSSFYRLMAGDQSRLVQAVAATSLP
jgi:micrococcal nuclease